MRTVEGNIKKKISPGSPGEETPTRVGHSKESAKAEEPDGAKMGKQVSLHQTDKKSPSGLSLGRGFSGEQNGAAGLSPQVVQVPHCPGH